MVVALLALLLRFWLLQRLLASPFFDPIPGGNDRSLYAAIAQQVAAGQWFPTGSFEYLPLYGWILGLFQWLFGRGALYVAGLTGCLLDAAATWLIIRLARAIGARSWSAIAVGLLYAAYPLAAVYATVGMPNCLNAFLLLAFASAAFKLRPESPPWRWLLIGLLVGVASLGFAGMLAVVAGCLLFWLFAGFRGPLRLGLFLLGVLLPIAPVTAHNWKAERQVILISAHGGFNFYQGNHERADGYPVQVQDFRSDAKGMLADAHAEAERVTGRTLSAAEASDYWAREAWTFIREHPGMELKVLGLKWMRFWNRVEYDDMRLLPMLALSDVLPRHAGWLGFAAWGILGLLGLVLARRACLLKVVAGAAMLSLIAFFITARYRLTVVPLLAVLGAGGLTALGEIFARRASPSRAAGRSRFVALGAMLAALIMVFFPMPLSDFRALDRYNTAAYLLAGGRAEEALLQAEAGLEIAPRQADLHFVAANALFGLDRLDEAAASYAAALFWNSNLVSARFNLAVVEARRGNAKEAQRILEEVLRRDPGHRRAVDLLEELRASDGGLKPDTVP